MNSNGGGTSTPPPPPAGWYSDPSGRFEFRYWDGSEWTRSVASGGRASYDEGPVRWADPGSAMPSAESVISPETGNSDGRRARR